MIVELVHHLSQLDQKVFSSYLIGQALQIRGVFRSIEQGEVTLGTSRSDKDLQV